MFDLAYSIDDSIEINGNTYDLDLSFDNVLRLIDMLNDKELSDYEQIQIGLQMLLGVCFICDLETQADIFYEVFENTIGKEAKESVPVDIEGNAMPTNGNNEKTHDIKQDAPYIYASFMSDYGIDLFEQQGKLHWYKFKALLGGLTDGSKFLRVIEIRTMELPKGKGSEKDKKKILELKEHYALKGDD